MSSNSYGFTCYVTINIRRYLIRVIYANTHEYDSYNSLLLFENKFGTITDVSELAKKEIEFRKNNEMKKVLSIYGVYGGYINSDPLDKDLPIPSDNLILEVIASGKAEDIDIGWDT